MGRNTASFSKDRRARANGSAAEAVPMLNDLFNPHLGNLQNALDRTTARQKCLMENLANVNVAGYKRKDLDFHIVLDDEMQAIAGNQSLQPSVGGGSNRPDGNGVDLEAEIAAIAETEIRFQALTDMTARYFSGLKNVIREGR